MPNWNENHYNGWLELFELVGLLGLIGLLSWVGSFGFYRIVGIGTLVGFDKGKIVFSRLVVFYRTTEIGRLVGFGYGEQSTITSELAFKVWLKSALLLLCFYFQKLEEKKINTYWCLKSCCHIFTTRCSSVIYLGHSVSDGVAWAFCRGYSLRILNYNKIDGRERLLIYKKMVFKENESKSKHSGSIQ